MSQELRVYLRRVRGFPPDARLYLATTVLGGFSGSISGLYFNLYLRALGYGQDFIGVMAAVPAFVTLALALPLGLVAGRMGYKRAFLVGMGLQGVSALIVCLVPERPLLLGAALVGGLGGTLGGVVGAPFLAESARDEERGFLFGFQAGLGVLAGTVGSALAGFLPQLLGRALGLSANGVPTYRAVLLVAFGLFCLSALPMFFLRGGAGRQLPRLQEVVRHKDFVLRLSAIQLGIGLGAGLVIPFVNLFFKVKFNASDPMLGMVFAVNSLLIGAGNFASPLLARRIGRGPAVLWPQVLSLPFIFLWGYGPTLALSGLGYLVRTPLMNLAGPVFSAMVMELVPPALRSTLNGILMLTWNGGWAVGALASGYVQTHWGFNPLFVGTVVLYSVAIYLNFRLFARIR